MPQSVDKSQLGLHPAHVVEVEGLLFVCLTNTPPDLNPIVDDIKRFFAPHRLPDARICHWASHHIRANWKIVTENHKVYDGGVTAIQFFPLNWIMACNDYAILSRFTPVSPQETDVEITWLVDGNAQEGDDYSVEEVTWLWAKTVEEDAWLCENNQRGVNSRRYEPGPYSTMEVSAAGFVDWYLKQLRLEA